MKNKLLLALALLGLSAPAFAQVSDSEESKNHLGIIASPSLDKLFRDNRSLPVGLIYKRQVKENQALRLTAVGSYRKQDEPEVINNAAITKHDFSYLTLNSMLGYEWQQQLNKHFVFYYGVDAGVNLNRSVINSFFQINYQNFPGEENRREETTQTKNVALTYRLKPMIGFQFQIHPKLYVAAESSMMLDHTRLRSESAGTIHYVNEEIPDHFSEYSHESLLYNVWYQPLSNIQLVYKF